jgi:tetratricopeptide (TPR) repeat protein
MDLFGKLKRILPPLAILAVSFIVYFNALFNGFVYDDMAQVLENPWVRDFRSVPDMFGRSVSGFVIGSAPVNYYRPLMHLTYMITYHVFGLKAWGFHLVNILFHAANSVMAYLIAARLLADKRRPLSSQVVEWSGNDSSARQLTDSTTQQLNFSSLPLTIHDSRFPAFIAALLFATHPVHTEAVAWVAAVPEAAYTFFYLSSFYFYMRFHPPLSPLPSREGRKRVAFPQSGSYRLSLASFCLSVFFKEPALTLPLILVLYDRSVKKERFTLAGARRYLPYVVVICCYFVLRLNALGDVSPVTAFPELNAYRLFINVFPLFTQYIEKLFLPLDLKVWHEFHPITSLLTARGALSLLATATFLCLVCIAFRLNAPAFIGLVFLIVPLLPAFHISGIVGKPFAERYLYLPSFGLALLFGVLMERERARAPGRAAMTAIVLLAAAGVFSVATVNRNTVWKDNYTLFRDTVEKSPDAFMPRSGLANALFERGMLDESIGQYRIALSLLGQKPADPDVLSAVLRNFGTAYLYKGWLDEAIEQYRSAVAAKPDYAEAHADLAFAYEEKGWMDLAVSEYRVALSFQPRSRARAAAIHNNLGVVYWKRGMISEAREQFEAAVRLDPENPSYAGNLRRVR